jgi:hypothetical protein
MHGTPQDENSDPLLNAAGLLSDFPGALVTRDSPSSRPIQTRPEANAGTYARSSPTHGRMAASLTFEP